jgi:CheY-like chemotaxis protein
MTMKLDTVLLIDDSDIDNMVNKRVIERTGLATDVVVKNSARAAIDYLHDLSDRNTEKIPSAIFLDIRMPDTDGFGFLELFETLPSVIHEKARIIMLSSSIDSDDYKKAMDNRFVKQFLNKPLHKESVINLINV